MKIYISKANHKPIQFIIPNALLMNRMVASIGAHAVRQTNDIQITSDDIHKLLKVLKDSKKIFGNYFLVEVETNDGEFIHIEL